MIDKILDLYRGRYSFSAFYDNLAYNIRRWPKFHIPMTNFLTHYPFTIEYSWPYERIHTTKGDIRVDLPVWFGDYKSSGRIVVLGSEPRDTDDSGILNIERQGSFVFATPFALERPKGPYHKAFYDAAATGEQFVYFTDVVKEYAVLDEADKRLNDQNARKNFRAKATANAELLLQELDYIQPDKIVALGNDSYSFLEHLLGKTSRLVKVRHPSRGGAETARNAFRELLKSL